MEQKFTPGPWKVDGKVSAGFDVVDAGGFFVAMARKEANANLTASAPDLLTSLELAEGFISGFEDDETQTNVPWMLATIRATIGEARGLPAQ